MEYLNLKIDFGSLRNDFEYRDKKISEYSSFFASRIHELRERLTALETHYFKRLDDFKDVQQIIGKPEGETDPSLDQSPLLRK